jgi:hypothetical protein
MPKSIIHIMDGVIAFIRFRRNRKSGNPAHNNNRCGAGRIHGIGPVKRSGGYTETVADLLEVWRKRYPEKFVPEEKVFGLIHRGNRIFISTGCGEPQYLVRALIIYLC